MTTNYFKSVKDSKPLKEIDLISVFKSIKEGDFKSQIDQYHDALKFLTKEESSEKKKSLTCFTPSGTFDPSRGSGNLLRYSGVVHVDLDKLTPDQLHNCKNILREDPYILCYFISPSMNGLKVFAKVDALASNHKNAWLQFRAYISQLTGISDEIKNDISVSDVSRLCFVSYDPEAHINIESETFNVTLPTPSKKNTTNYSSDHVKFNFPLESPQQCWDFTSTRSGHTFNEGDRNNFIFWYACNCSNWGITQADTLQYALSQKLSFPIKEIKECVNSAYKKTVYGSLKYNTTITQEELPNFQTSKVNNSLNNPIIPDSVYAMFPQLLKEACDIYENGREMDVFALSAITAISGCLNNVFCKYGKRKIYPNLCLVIIAPPASKKSTLKDARPLLKSYKIEVNSKLSEEFGFTESSAYSPSVWIGADSSTAALNGIINANNSCGVLWSTELKTLIGNLKQEFGNYTSTLLKTYHNEPIEVNRRGNNGKSEQLSIESPKFSILFSGVEEDLKWLITGRNSGLTSRFLMYVFNENSTWEDLFDEEDAEELLDPISITLAERIKDANQLKIQFKLCENQKKLHTHVFSKLLEENLELSDVIKRLGVGAIKMAMTLSVIRGVAPKNGVIYCEENDFQAAMTIIVDVLFSHLYNAIKNHDQHHHTWDGENIIMYLKPFLSKEFTKQDFLNAAKKLKINLSDRQIDNHRRKAELDNLIFKVKQGVYRYKD